MAFFHKTIYVSPLILLSVNRMNPVVLEHLVLRARNNLNKMIFFDYKVFAIRHTLFIGGNKDETLPNILKNSSIFGEHQET